MQIGTISNLTRFLSVIGLSAMLVAGCVSPITSKRTSQPVEGAPSTVELTSDFSRSKLIAADFVSTMTQLPESNPSETILHTNKPSSRFGELLLSSLQGAGFDLRIGDARSSNWLAYNAKREDTSSDAGNPIYTFIISAGSIKLKRSYEVDQYGVKPAGSMFVRGATTDNVAMDNSIFSVRTAVKPTEAAPIEPFPEEVEEVQLSAVPTPAVLIKTPTEVAALAPDVESQPDIASQKAAELSAAVASLEGKTGAGDYSEFSNMYNTGESRYSSILQEYEVVDSNVYVFPNDSLVMGKRNKDRLRKMTQNFNSETDVVSVIGCSHGRSNLENGNAYLANNRAFRVKEEFVLAGLSPDKVLEEGCWAAVDHPNMPARGVVVNHRRLKN